MKKTLIFLFALTLVVIITQPAQACEPCLEVLTLEETAAAADLIIIGKKVGEGPRTDDGEGWGGPEWIEVQVIEVLKGKVDQTTIKVNSWYGMCAYGIIIQDKREYLIFLHKPDSPQDETQYAPVEWGCAVTRYPIEDSIVIKEYEDDQIPLDDLLTQLGLKRQAPPTPEPKPTEEVTKSTGNSDTTGWQICPGWILLLPLAGIIWKKKYLD